MTAPVPGQPLSSRQAQCLILLGQGLTDAEIAARLHITRGTAHRHVEDLCTKLRARTRVHAVALGFHAGILT